MQDETGICNREERRCLKVFRDFKHIQSRKGPLKIQEIEREKGKPLQQVRLISLPGKIK